MYPVDIRGFPLPENFYLDDFEMLRFQRDGESGGITSIRSRYFLKLCG